MPTPSHEKGWQGVTKQLHYDHAMLYLNITIPSNIYHHHIKVIGNTLIKSIDIEIDNTWKTRLKLFKQL